ncbi:hypothetical protein BASA81_003260 [Batrachochytrium salamandrivorans]|nr:hypothetical protein BASA81_003260 [Batrachochytrium salamandrivorans]
MLTAVDELRQRAILALADGDDEGDRGGLLVATEALEEVCFQPDPQQLHAFLKSSWLTSQLQSSGALGNALLACARRGMVDMAHILASKTGLRDRIRAAMQSLQVVGMLGCLLKSCKTDEEESQLLQACLLVECNESLLAALHCLGVRRLGSPTVLFQQCAKPNGEELVSRLVKEFEWSTNVLERAEEIWASSHQGSVPFPIASITLLEDDAALLACVENDDAVGIHTTFRRSTSEALLLCAQHNRFNALSALLQYNQEDVLPCLLLAAEHGSMDVVSRLLVLFPDYRETVMQCLNQQRITNQAAVETKAVVDDSLSLLAATLTLADLNDHVLERIFLYLSLDALAKLTQTCQALATRPRRAQQMVRCLVQDFPTTNRLGGFVLVYSSKAMPSHAIELECKERALEEILCLDCATPSIIMQLGLDCADGEVSSLLEKLLQVVTVAQSENKVEGEGGFVLTPESVRAMLARVLTNERHKSLGVILRQQGNRFGGSRVLVDLLREESALGNATSSSLLMATLSRLAMESRVKRETLIAKRKLDWEQRGGIWGPTQREQFAGPTEQERDFDLGVAGALRRAGAEGHSAICSSILKMLQARNRLRDFALELEHVLLAAARGGHVSVLNEVFQYYLPPQPAVREEILMTAAKNGHHKVARMLVWDRQLVPPSEIKFKFIEGARKGHFETIKTLMATGAIGSGTCLDAIEEATRRGFVEDCLPFLQQALARLQRLEQEEEEEEGAQT